MISANNRKFSFFTNILGKKVHMLSDCEFFPNFDLTGKVVSIKPESNGETLITLLLSNGKTMYVGSNMKNLRYEIIQEA